MLSTSPALATAARLIDAGDPHAAEQICKPIVRQEPDNIHALRLLACAARRTDRPDRAVELLHQAIRANVRDAQLHFELGSSLQLSGRHADALVEYRVACELDPRLQEASLNLGAGLDRQGRPEEALAWCLRAAELDPNCAMAHYNLGNVLQSLGRLADASRHFARAIQLDPQFAKAHWNRACCLLLDGRFAEGWAEYEWRERAGEVPLDCYPQSRWQGEQLQGKTILVHAEQGIGDEILFASCLPELIPRAGRTVVICDPRLTKLLARSFPAANVAGCPRRKDRAPAQLPIPIEFQIPAGSLPLHLRPSRESFPRRARFLVADPVQRAAWRSRYDQLGAGVKVGISWRAGGQPSERRKRTTSLDQWRDLLATPGAKFINLQYGESAAEISAARDELGVTIHDWSEADPLLDMDAFAAKVAALDLVISVGNATVHLAGALGVPSWTMLPRVPGWRWMFEGRQSIWYPSVELFRQSQRGEWSDVFAEVGQRFNSLVGVKRANSCPFASDAQGLLPLGLNVATRHAQSTTFARLNEVGDALAAAVERFRAGDLIQAEKLCQEVIEHAPRNANAQHLLGIIARRTGRLDLAIRSISRAIAVWDKDFQMHFNLADALHAAGRLSEAQTSYRQSIQLKPDFAEAHHGLGNLLQASGRYAQAVACYRQALAIRPAMARTHNALGAALLHLERFPEAATALNEAIKLRPDYVAAHNNLGFARLSQGRLNDATSSYQQALELDENCFEAISQLALTLQRQNRLDDAADMLRRGLQLRPDDPALCARLKTLESGFPARNPEYAMPIPRVDEHCIPRHRERADHYAKG